MAVAAQPWLPNVQIVTASSNLRCDLSERLASVPLHTETQKVPRMCRLWEQLLFSFRLVFVSPFSHFIDGICGVFLCSNKKFNLQLECVKIFFVENALCLCLNSLF